MSATRALPVVEKLHRRRPALVEAWLAVVCDVCGYPPQDPSVRATLDFLLERIIDAIVEEAPLPLLARSIGQDLAELTCKRAELLGQTQLVLSRSLLDGLASHERETLQPALASMLGHMAEGFIKAPPADRRPASVQLDEARRAERRFYTTILDMVNALIIVVDLHGQIVGFNGACERVSGYTFDDVYGRHYSFLLPSETVESFHELQARLRRLTPKRRVFIPHDSVWLTRDGERRQIEWSTTAVFDDDGALNYIIGTGTDVTTRREMQRELDEAQRQVAQAKEAERVRLAQDLHDGAVQRLLGLSYQLAEMRRRAMEEGAWTPAQRLEELAPGLEVLRGDIIDVAQGLRRLISSLRPPALHEMGLAEVLDVYVADWQQGAGRAGPRVNLDISALDGKKVPDSVATCLFRLVQEGIWNAHKHAAATNVDVIVRHSDEEINLRIKDDGQGFHIPRHLYQFAASGRFGFIGMQERVHAVDGLLSIWSDPGQGTEIQAQIPLQSMESDDGESNARSLG